MVTEQRKSQHESDHRPAWEPPTTEYAAIMQNDSTGQTMHREARHMRNRESQEIRQLAIAMAVRLKRELLQPNGSAMVENMEHEEKDEDRKNFYEELSKVLEEELIDLSHRYRYAYCPVSADRGGPETCVYNSCRID